MEEEEGGGLWVGATGWHVTDTETMEWYWKTRRPNRPSVLLWELPVRMLRTLSLSADL